MKLDELKTQLALGTIKWRSDNQRRTEGFFSDLEDDIKYYINKLDSAIYYPVNRSCLAINVTCMNI